MMRGESGLIPELENRDGSGDKKGLYKRRNSLNGLKGAFRKTGGINLMYIDHSVYPDLEDPPSKLTTDEEKADYVERICGAWDFDVFPERETLDLFLGWKEIFDRYPLLHSPAYHTVRRLMDWED